jgi:hypothetical protein
MTRLTAHITQLRLAAVAAFATICALCFFPLLAWAAETVAAPAATIQQKWWQALLVPVMSAVGLIVATFIGLGLKKLTQLLEAKFKIDIPDQVEALMAEKAKQLVAWGEEQLEKRVLHGDGVKTPGAETITKVKDALWKFADGLGYGKQYTEEKLVQLVEGILHLNRAGSEGVIGSTSGSLRAETIVAKTNGNPK